MVLEADAVAKIRSSYAQGIGLEQIADTAGISHASAAYYSVTLPAEEARRQALGCSPLYMEFRDELHRALEGLDKTQVWLARQVGVRQESICRYLAARSMPQEGILSRICEVVGIDAERFMGLYSMPETQIKVRQELTLGQKRKFAAYVKRRLWETGQTLDDAAEASGLYRLTIFGSSHGRVPRLENQPKLFQALQAPYSSVFELPYDELPEEWRPPKKVRAPPTGYVTRNPEDVARERQEAQAFHSVLHQVISEYGIRPSQLAGAAGVSEKQVYAHLTEPAQPSSMLRERVMRFVQQLKDIS
ncbi:helix-turn-helix transcriptional regulator [Candidatus Woesearchaeota archaeon]|nr:helix-turn-helix transcriptional regulator [Candidatus Woesearchaeota archaeon]